MFSCVNSVIFKKIKTKKETFAILTLKMTLEPVSLAMRLKAIFKRNSEMPMVFLYMESPLN